MSMEVTMLEQRISDMERGVGMLRSSHTNLLIDIQVALEDDDPDEALTMIKEALDGVPLPSAEEPSMSHEEVAVWDVYFAEVYSWTLHPGYYRENATKPTMEQCADQADEMIAFRRKRLTEGCHL